MLEQLEEQLNGQKVILDTSGIVRPKKDILEFLCIGIGGLSNVDVEDFEEQISIFKQTRNLIENKGAYLIDETITELNHLLGIYSTKHQYFSQSKKIKDDRYKPKAKRIRELWYDHCDDIVEALKRNNEELFYLIKEANHRDPRKKFTFLQQKRYEHMFNLTEKLSRDMQHRYIQEKGDGSDPYMFNPLLTDQKIMAAALTLAYESPVTVITGDIDLVKINLRIGRELESKLSQTREGNLSVSYPVQVLRFNTTSRIFEDLKETYSP